MKKKFNNKGYMLIEIIMASAIAMVVAYFLMELTIKLKNKNDDLLVKTLVYTDQAIIYNKIAEDLYNCGNESVDINCDYINSHMEIDVSKNKFTYDGFTNIVSKYATLGTSSCNDYGKTITITIPITVDQLPDEKFDVVFKYTNP